MYLLPVNGLRVRGGSACVQCCIVDTNAVSAVLWFEC